MAAKDDNWFRRPARTAAERAYFEARLARTRSWTRVQYLHIQGLALLESGDARPALAMLVRAAAEPDDFIVANVEKTIGDCHRLLGEPLAAIDAYRRSIMQMRAHPGVRCLTQLDFAGLVLEESLGDLYQEARDYLLEDWDPNPIFPAYELEQFGYLALILAALGHTADAILPARRALAAAAKTKSGAAKHRRLGLAGDRHRPLIRKLERVAKGRKPIPAPADARQLIDRLRRWLGKA